MTPRQARTAANVIIGAAGLVAAYVVITTPPLRRLALRASRYYLGAGLPAYLAAATTQAWLESKRSA
jgi:hypothetical protein